MQKSTSRHIIISELRVGMYIAQFNDSWIDHPFFRTSFLIKDEKDLQKVIDSGVQEVWIDETKGIAKSQIVSEEMKESSNISSPIHTVQTVALQDKQISESKLTLKDELVNARNICLSAKKQVEIMFHEVRMGKTVDAQSTLPLVENVMASVARNPAAIISVARLKTHDNYTYMHSVAVCALMVALANQLKLPPAQIKLAGQGGLLHDLGKAFIPLEILNKPDKLTDDEFALIKGHPIAGAKALASKNVSQEVYDVVLHHHEKMDGGGYNDGLKGGDIPLFAKMAACCDVYDAVTSERSYKGPWAPAYALIQMTRWKNHFDQEIFQAFVKSVGIYPVGSLVKLSSGKLAVVVEPSEYSLLTPKVCEFFSISKNEMIPMQMIDISEKKNNIKILGPEDPQKWGFTHLDQIWQ